MVRQKKMVIATLVVVLCLPVGGCFVLRRLNRASSSVAFLGDSITEGWSLPRENFGIHGQTTAQMRERFQRQIPGHRTVIILGGTNDTLLGIDPATTIANLDAMLKLAREDGVEPVLAEIPPIYRDAGKFLPAVDHLDQAIHDLARQRHVPLADYYSALLGHPNAYSDGVHMKRRGYLRMEAALLRAKNIF